MARFTGAEVVRKHQTALTRCRGKSGWDLLACIVDEMQREYGKGLLGAPA